jgi:hypothetical protein
MLLKVGSTGEDVKKLQTKYVLVHLHGNNHTPLSADHSCDCYEFTFSFQIQYVERISYKGIKR